MEDYAATIKVTLGLSCGHAESSDVSGGLDHNDPDPTIRLRDHLLELRPLGPVSYTHLDVYKRQPLAGQMSDLEPQGPRN